MSGVDDATTTNGMLFRRAVAAEEERDAATARAEVAERVVEAMRSRYPARAWDIWRKWLAEEGNLDMLVDDHRALILAVLEYDATRGGSE